MVKEYGYEYDAILHKEIFEKSKGKVTYEKFMGGMCLRSGRDALKVVAREFEPSIVLLPALACNSMIISFEMYGHKIKYYRLNKDYSIDLESLYSLIPAEKKRILFLYMDYFGNRAIQDSDLDRLRSSYPALIFIEDRTHNLFVKTSHIFKCDFTIASLRKWINIPDGGLLWTDKKLKKRDYSEDLTFSEIRLHAQCMRNEFLQTGEEGIKNEYRRIFSTVTDLIDIEMLPGLMSLYSYKLATKANLKNINEVRCRNAQVLINELRGFKFIQPQSGLGDLYAAILIENRDAVQRMLASMGIFCTIIWPLNDEQRLVCEIARYTEDHVLAVYCDQRYTIEDMKYIAFCIRRVCNG